MAKASNRAPRDVTCPCLIRMKAAGVRALMGMMKECEMVVWLPLDVLQRIIICDDLISLFWSWTWKAEI